ncbi:uncharacterized protein H6S33_009403 [Morchella sextelata]|uniref:uncharacterized protein n=1 Tax=Morchella sextelata TaxID=1174677 RepID=UPI001D0532D2|nr:uncharacterized protein H6S33_009403 [Morchella sextelata]KAH0613023.1 hypothetical protein H6S33_009403 [Morchella sextelata]
MTTLDIWGPTLFVNSLSTYSLSPTFCLTLDPGLATSSLGRNAECQCQCQFQVWFIAHAHAQLDPFG